MRAWVRSDSDRLIPGVNYGGNFRTYTNNHVAGRQSGWELARKLVSTAGWAKHSILYEFTSLAAREKNFQGQEDIALDEKEWTGRVIRYVTHAPGSPSVGRRIWPPAE